MQEKKELQIGDELGAFFRGRLQSLTKIKRLTKTLAVAENGVRFRKEYSNNWIQRVGSNTWSTTTWRFVTKKEKNLFDCSLMLQEINGLFSRIDVQEKENQTLIKEIYSKIKEKGE